MIPVIAFVIPGGVNSVGTPAGVIRTILFVCSVAIQMLPSGPATSSLLEPTVMPAGSANSPATAGAACAAGDVARAVNAPATRRIALADLLTRPQSKSSVKVLTGEFVVIGWGCGGWGRCSTTRKADMNARLGAVLGAIAIGVLVVSVANFSQASSKADDASRASAKASKGKYVVARFDDAVEGIVVAKARPRGIIGVLISLHSLEPNTSYELTGNRKPCSVVDAADYVIWRDNVKTDSNDDIYAQSSGKRRGSPLRGKSIRIAELTSSDSPTEVACSRSANVEDLSLNFEE